MIKFPLVITEYVFFLLHRYIRLHKFDNAYLSMSDYIPDGVE